MLIFFFLFLPLWLITTICSSAITVIFCWVFSQTTAFCSICLGHSRKNPTNSRNLRNCVYHNFCCFTIVYPPDVQVFCRARCCKCHSSSSTELPHAVTGRTTLLSALWLTHGVTWLALHACTMSLSLTLCNRISHPSTKYILDHANQLMEVLKWVPCLAPPMKTSQEKSWASFQGPSAWQRTDGDRWVEAGGTAWWKSSEPARHCPKVSEVNLTPGHQTEG